MSVSFGEGAALPRPELSDPVGSLEVPEHELINSHEVLVAIGAAAVSEGSQVPE
jgi:hypothetical protein